MTQKNSLSIGATALLLLGFAVLWGSNGKGVIQDDPERNIAIPKNLLVPLQVRTSYNNERIFFQYRWPAEKPSYFHDVYRYEKGEWKRYGNAVPGSQPQGLHEDRVAMLVDDGSVPEFARYGGYITVGSGLVDTTHQASGDDVENHPYLGKQRGQEEVTKYLPQTRHSGDWADTQSGERIQQMRKAGYFLDLWHWRSARSNPLGFADDQVVYDARSGDQGRSAWFTNWDREKKQPRVMFNPEVAGHAALKWDDIQAGRIDPDSIYYLHETTMQPFDPDHAWQEGDVLPRRALRTPAGSRSDIAADGRWSNGYWQVTLSRLMDTGAPLDDKIFMDGGEYAVGFAIHRNATGGRWHYVSLPVKLGLGRDSDLVAQSFVGETPDWNQPWHEVKLFYPGQVTWPHLTSKAHAGSERIARKIPASAFHKEEQLAVYGIEAEFREALQTQWRLTLFAGLLLLASLGFTLFRMATPAKGGF
ncbi:MAG: hypothetical protein IBX50_11405 [Marinospirillum sp.]|uniref:ethylbenzene dehydrogenase-related protein n=1 Tax=Marinospirillum sp. TaxID=2183934 RepID=UPI001A0222DD|nr:ethylbenzene dehydrogenase-related protein [Marinospirillum sp.]MBE0507303.1 hypothetical protein [Marinospirillum sp.]